MFDQSKVMFNSPAPPLPAPRKFTLWLRLANQHKGAREATKGKANSGRNCQANIPRKSHQKTFKSFQHIGFALGSEGTNSHLLAWSFKVKLWSSLDTSIDSDLLHRKREDELGIVNQNWPDHCRKRETQKWYTLKKWASQLRFRILRSREAYPAKEKRDGRTHCDVVI